MSGRVVEVFRSGRVGSDGLSNLVGVTAVSVGTTVLNSDSGRAFRCTAALELTLPAATSSGWSLIIDADGGDVTVTAPMGIDGGGSVLLQDGNSLFVFSDGATMYGRYYARAPYTPLWTFDGTDVSTVVPSAGAFRVYGTVGSYELFRAFDDGGVILNYQGVETLHTRDFGADLTGILKVSGSIEVGGLPLLLDEDDMASDSDTQAPTQQSTKAYVQSEIQSAIVAVAICDGTATPALTGERNLTVARSGTGIFDYTFDTPQADINYIVNPSTAYNATPRIAAWGSKTVNGFRVYIQNTSNNPVDWAHDVSVVRA